MLYCELAFQLVRVVLGIPVETIPQDVARDFYICVGATPFMNDEWACWSMANYMRVFGKPLGMED